MASLRWSATAHVYVCLALSPSSVPVEQLLFSTAGSILNGKRSQLSPFRMNMVCFYPNVITLRSGICRHNSDCPVVCLSRLKFSAIFLRQLVA